MDIDNSLKGIGLFCMEVLHLVSIGKTETIDEVEMHFEKQDIIEYIYKKYKPHFFINFECGTYNNKVLNEFFYNYSSYIPSREQSKFGIENENDGLLLIVSLVMDLFEHNAIYIKLPEADI